MTRLALLPATESRDGTVDRDEQLVNTLAEIDTPPVATVRPGLVELVTGEGAGNGTVCFDGALINVFGATFNATTRTTTTLSGFDTPADLGMRFVQQVRYLGSTWYAFCDTWDSFGTDCGIWTSTDGVSWSPVLSSLDLIIDTIMEVNGELKARALFYDYDLDVETDVILTITAGGAITYTPVASSIFTPVVYWNGVFYGYVYLTGAYRWATSLDMLSYTVGDIIYGYPSRWFSVFNGKLFRVGELSVTFAGSEIFYQDSVDGLTWGTPTSFGNGDNVSARSSVVMGDTLYIAVYGDYLGAYADTLYKTTDGVNFTTVGTDLFSPSFIRKMWSDDTTLYAITPTSENQPETTSTYVHTSTDAGVTWEVTEITTGKFLNFGWHWDYESNPVKAAGLWIMPVTAYVTGGIYIQNTISIAGNSVQFALTPLGTGVDRFYDFAQSPL